MTEHTRVYMAAIEAAGAEANVLSLERVELMKRRRAVEKRIGLLRRAIVALDTLINDRSTEVSKP